LSQHFLDVQVLDYVEEILCSGLVSLNVDQSNDCRQFKIRDKVGLLIIAEILNGNLYLPEKKLQFKNFLNGINKKYKLNFFYIINLNEFSLNTAWVIGFLDTEGSLSARIVNNGKYLSVNLTFSQAYSSELISKLAAICNGTYSLSKHNYWEVSISFTKFPITVLPYISKYKLQTKRQYIFKYWSEINRPAIQKVYLTAEGHLKMTKLADKIQYIHQNYFLIARNSLGKVTIKDELAY